MGPGHRDWLVARRKRAHEPLPLDHEDGASILRKLKTGMARNTRPRTIVDPGAAGEADSAASTLKARGAAYGRRKGGEKSLTGQMP
jgi:hypothetical protein